MSKQFTPKAKKMSPLRGLFYASAAATLTVGAGYGAHELTQDKTSVTQSSTPAKYSTDEYGTTYVLADNGVPIAIGAAPKEKLSENQAQGLLLVTACALQPADCNNLRLASPGGPFRR